MPSQKMTQALGDLDYSEYSEPVYPLTKREKFDEDNMKPLLSDTRFNKKDRERLTNYNKHRLSGGVLNVSYRFGRGCEENHLGRLFPDDEIGLQSYRFDIRNPLAKRYYWDIDMENAHYRIASKFCDQYKIQNARINEYIANREIWLGKVSNSRKKAKTEFLKILYGGNIKLYNDSFEEADGNLTTEGIKFLKEIETEVKALMDKIWTEHPSLHKLKVGSENKPIMKKPNPKASLMSLIFQTEERKMLMFLDWLLSKKGRYMGVYIHDGGYVEKLDGETYFPPEILNECAKHIENYFDTPMILTQKAIEYDWTPAQSNESQYQIRKKEFEKRNFFIKDTFVHINEDSTIEYLKPSTMELQLKCNNWMEYNADLDKNVKKYFYKEWLEDPDRAKYEKIDFIPDVNKCPSYVYNLFKGFKAESIEPSRTFTEAEIFIMVQPILKHIQYITDGFGGFVMKWLANIIQNPTQKTEVALLLRDMGGLLTEGGGTGKSSMIDYFGTEILGEDYYYVVNDNRELYGNFNGQFQGKLLVVVDEASSKENHGNHDILKAKITAKKQNVNSKNVNQYTVADYSNYIFFSNNTNPIPIRQGNRRFSAFDTNPCMRGNERYFKDLFKYLNRSDIKWAFFQ